MCLQHVNFYFEMTYKGVHLSLRVEGTCPFLQAVSSHITHSSITPESIQTRFFQKRSGLFSTHVKGQSCEIYKCFKNRNFEKRTLFPSTDGSEVSQEKWNSEWLLSDTRLAFAGRQPKIERRKCAVHPPGRWQHGLGFRLYRNTKLYLTAICYVMLFVKEYFISPNPYSGTGVA
jgi:hypothetical protein